MSAVRKIPALVVSGFLGSGKTTLVRHLLDDAQRRGIRLAVISNEFGALGIDQAMLGGRPDAIVELDGGCVCCQLSNELVDTLQQLRQRIDPDRIIVETSGLALPSETLLSFWREPVAQWIADDFGVVVINAEQVLEERDLRGTFEDQVTSADLLILNKIDCIPAAAIAGIERRIRELEPEAPLIHAIHGDVDPELLFLPTQITRPRPVQPHTHEAFEATEICFPRGVTAAQIESEIRVHAPVRAKGFVVTDKGLHLVQGVGDHLRLEAVAVPPDDALLGRVVVIRRR